MDRVHRIYRASRISSILFSLALTVLLLTLLATRVHTVDLSSMLFGAALATFCLVLFFLFGSLLRLRAEQRQTAHTLDIKEASLLESEERFRQMADNIHEIFWMIDARTKRVL